MWPFNQILNKIQADKYPVHIYYSAVHCKRMAPQGHSFAIVTCRYEGVSYTNYVVCKRTGSAAQIADFEQGLKDAMVKQIKDTKRY